MGASEIISAIALLVAVVSAIGALNANRIAAKASKTSQAALDWQQDRAETKVKIMVWHAAEERAGIVVNVDQPDRVWKFYDLQIEVVNDGETTEFVADIWLATVDLAEVKEHRLESDRELKPHARLVIEPDIESMPEIAAGPFVVAIRLAKGEVIESAEQRLDPKIVAQVEEHNGNV
jgi:hypothetical protein